MYVPKQFRQEDTESLHAFMRSHNFATLVTQGQRPLVSHLPLALAAGPPPLLLGHMARANPQWQQFADGIPVLAWSERGAIRYEVLHGD